MKILIVIDGKNQPGLGEELVLPIAHAGHQNGQGIAYLPSGAKIVVRDGASLVGKYAPIKIENVVFFARICGASPETCGTNGNS